MLTDGPGTISFKRLTLISDIATHCYPLLPIAPHCSTLLPIVPHCSPLLPLSSLSTHSSDSLHPPFLVGPPPFLLLSLVQPPFQMQTQADGRKDLVSTFTLFPSSWKAPTETLILRFVCPVLKKKQFHRSDFDLTAKYKSTNNLKH